MRRAVPALLAAGCLALTLTGCRIPVPTYPTPTTHPTTTRPGPTTSTEPTTTVPSTAPPITVVPDPTTTEAPTSKPTTTVPPTTVPATTTVPPTTPPTGEDGTQAAVALGWGKPTGGDEFDGTALDTKRWGAYDGKGHGGNGRRSPSAFTVSGGVLTVTGDSAGTTGGMAYRGGQYRGKWETRMQVPVGDGSYHPVLLLWPNAEDWPTGGEVDYAETTAASHDIQFFLHYSAQNRQTSARLAVDLTQWHNYAVAWANACVTGYVDAVQWFKDCDASHLPPRAMHPTIQLDWFPNGSRTAESSMRVAWMRVYSA